MLYNHNLKYLMKMMCNDCIDPNILDVCLYIICKCWNCYSILLMVNLLLLFFIEELDKLDVVTYELKELLSAFDDNDVLILSNSVLTSPAL